MTKSKVSQIIESSQYLKNEHLFKNDSFSVSLATQLPDRLAAFKLLYEVYLEKGFVKPNQNKYWATLFDMHHDTITLIAKQNDQVIAAVTCVNDSRFGLPCDELFAEDINPIRQKKEKMIEITSLGISSNARGGNQILLKLFQLIYHLATLKYQADHLVITVNPRHKIFYEKKLLFEQIGSVKSYQKVAGAPAALMCLPTLKLKDVMCLDNFGCHQSYQQSIYQQFDRDSNKQPSYQTFATAHQFTINEFKDLFLHEFKSSKDKKFRRHFLGILKEQYNNKAYPPTSLNETEAQGIKKKTAYTAFKKYIGNTVNHIKVINEVHGMLKTSKN